MFQSLVSDVARAAVCMPGGHAAGEASAIRELQIQWCVGDRVE